MGIKKLTELELVTPESSEDASVYGEYNGKVVKLSYGLTKDEFVTLNGYIKLSINADDMGLDATIYAEEEET